MSTLSQRPLAEATVQYGVVGSSGSQPTPRLHFIDGLRAFAMLIVLFHHAWQLGGKWHIDLPLGHRHLPLAYTLVFGHVGVNLFLALSGFCLFWPYAKSGKRIVPLAEFAKKRCRRILPPYYAALVLFGLVPLVVALFRHNMAEAGFLGRWLILHVFMLHNLLPGYVINVNPALWSLALEFQLYILFPLLVALFYRFSSRAVVLGALAITTALRLFFLKAGMVTSIQMGYVLCYGVWARFFEFALGMWAAQVVAEWYRTGISPLRRLDYVFGAAVVILGAASFRHATFGAEGTFWFLPLTDAFFGVLFIALILAASRPKTFTNRIFANRPMVAVGIFSYSVYLIHMPLVAGCSAWLLQHGIKGTAMLLIDLVGIIPLAIGLGYVFHRLFEKPFMTAPKVAKNA